MNEGRKWMANERRLRARAAELGLFTVPAVAEQMNVSQTWARQVIQGKQVLADTAAARFARALDADVSALFDEVRS